jgi:hypothetical protein
MGGIELCGDGGSVLEPTMMIRRTERGSATVLALGLSVTVFATAGIATDGTRAYLVRTRLQNVADSAALAAADRIDIDSYHRSRGSEATIEIDAARATVSELLAELPADVHTSVSISRDGINIRLSTTVPTSFLGLIGISRLSVVADARARPIIGPVPR